VPKSFKSFATRGQTNWKNVRLPLFNEKVDFNQGQSVDPSVVLGYSRFITDGTKTGYQTLA
jgi:hypothetical protein